MRHNLSEAEVRERAALYALGALPEDEARAFEQLLADGCETCDAELQAYRLMVGKLGFEAAQEQPPPRARVRLFEELGGQTEAASGPALRQAAPGDSLTVRFNEGEWLAAGEGIYVKRLFADAARGTATTLYRLLPGTRCPGHIHQGVEECLVLQGDFHINGEALGPGDYHCALPGSVDETLYTIGGALLLIVGTENHVPLMR